MRMCFILDENRQPQYLNYDNVGTPAHLEQIQKWCEWHDNEDNRRIGYDVVCSNPQITISSICLGIGDEQTGLFEVAFFIGGSIANIFRFNTWEETEKAHAALLKLDYSNVNIVNKQIEFKNDIFEYLKQAVTE